MHHYGKLYRWWLLLVLLQVMVTQSAADEQKPAEAPLGWETPALVRHYHHNAIVEIQWAWRALSHYRFRGDERILDLGSGDGKISALLSAMVPAGRVTGIDISSEMVSFASKMFPPCEYPNLRFALSGRADASERFDLITSFCLFHLVPNPKELLINLREKMEPEGKLVLMFPIGGNLEYYRAVADEMAKRGWTFSTPLTEEAFQIRDLEKIPQILSQTGFQVEHLGVVDTRIPFSTKEELVDWFGVSKWDIPQAGRREFFIDLANRYLHYRPQDAGEDGFVYFSSRRVEIVASPK